ncbi:MAG: YqeG family HAD IIIA-type phosphatase [Bacilli bacterium]|nr:YqeG family HAD IIIA-type phosphatase [Bacilli bacterium]
MIRKIFIPKKYVKDIFNIDYEKLKRDGYKILIFDLDNTIGSIKENTCDKETSDFLNSLNKDFKVIIASNSRKKRVNEFCSNLNVYKMHLSLKPLGIILWKIKKKYNINYKEMVIIGDQLMTDIFLGNRYKLLTILVDKKGENDLNITKFNRALENRIKKKYNMKVGEYF